MLIITTVDEFFPQVLVSTLADAETSHDATTLPRNYRQMSHRHTRSISRSVSDVASATLSDDLRPDDAFMTSTPQLNDETEMFNDNNNNDDSAVFTGFDSAHYRGFLLRHGSYERYKIRARKKDPLESELKVRKCGNPNTRTI